MDRTELEQDKSLIRDKDYKRRLDKDRRDRDHDDKDLEIDSHHDLEKHQVPQQRKTVHQFEDSATEQSSQGRNLFDKFGGHGMHFSFDDKNAFRSESFGLLCVADLLVVIFSGSNQLLRWKCGVRF